MTNSLIRWWFFFRIVVPVIGRVVRATLRTEAMALVTLWSGVPKKIDDIACYWTAQAINAKWPIAWDRQLYWSFYVLAWVIFMIGHLINSYLTIFFFRLIFLH